MATLGHYSGRRYRSGCRGCSGDSGLPATLRSIASQRQRSEKGGLDCGHKLCSECAELWKRHGHAIEPITSNSSGG